MKKIIFLIFTCFSLLQAFRPDSKPLISGDTFRAIANHIYDETTKSFDANKVACGDTIFINLSHVEQFFTNVHPHIKVPYILMSHNHDYSAPGNFKHMLDDPKLAAWFTQNADLINHPKLIPIPIGLSNKHWQHSREHDKMIMQAQAARPKNLTKKYLLYVNFNVHTAPSVRQPVYDFFKKLPFCSWVANKPYRDYLIDLTQSKFVLSPHGNGLDCHRTWETLYMGSYPLVKSSTLDPLYENLPVLIVKDWSEVTPDFLEAKYRELSLKTYQYEKLYFEYWHNEVRKAQKRVREML